MKSVLAWWAVVCLGALPAEASSVGGLKPAHFTLVTPSETGWAGGAGVLGLAGAVAVVGLTLSSEVLRAIAADEGNNPKKEWNSDWTACVVLGSTSVVVNAIVGPLTFTGSRSTRLGAGVPGRLGLRIAAWSLYGVSLAMGLSLVVLAPAGIRPPPVLISASGLVGGTGLLLFALDAFAAHGQAQGRVGRLVPLLVPVVSEGRVGGAVGVGGRF